MFQESVLVMKKTQIFIFLGLLCLSFLFLFLFLSTSKEPKKEEFVSVSVDDERVVYLYEMANPSDSLLSMQDVYKKGTFSNEFILGTAFVFYLKEHPDAVKVSEEEIGQSIHKIFGDIVYAHDSGNIVSPYVCSFRHNKGEKNYTYLKGCTTNDANKIYRVLVDARKSDREYILTEKLIFVKNNIEEAQLSKEPVATLKVYNDMNESKLLDEKTFLWETEMPFEVDIHDYLENASTYEYHFVFDGENFVYKNLVRLN